MPDCLTPAVKPDGVVVLAYPADRGGCGPRTSGLLRRLAETAPVVVCRPAGPGPAAREVPPADPACAVREVPAAAGASQNAAIVDAMREAGIRAPVLVLVDPSFRRFWRRAYGSYRVFALSPRLREDAAAGRGDRASRLTETLASLLERSVDVALTETAEDERWIRDRYAYTGACLEAERLLPAPWACLERRTTEKHGRPATFPHRLQILVVVEPHAFAEAGGEVLTAFRDSSRHHVHFALGRTPDAAQPIVRPPRYDDFDVVMIHLPDGSDEPRIDGPAAFGLRRYPGLKVAFRTGRTPCSGSTAIRRRVPGVHLVADAGACEDDGEFVAELDGRLSRHVPGVPNWQIHVAGEVLACDAPSHEQLLGTVGHLAAGPRSSERPLDDLYSDERVFHLDVAGEVLDSGGDLLSVARHKKKALRKEIVALRRLKSELDAEVHVLQRRWKWSPARLGLFLRRNTLGRLRKAIGGLGAGR